MTRLLGLDIGSKRIGVAVSDELGLIASPVQMVLRGPKTAKEIQELIQRYGISELVIGLPVGMSGKEGPQALAIRDYVAELQAQLNLPVNWWDERLTTSIAEKTLIAGGTRRKDRKTQVDAMAASIILQGYLDHQRWQTSNR